ncbi:PTS sugar transporter subunit IIA [Caldanaerobacter sp.]|uniref:PTS sugar transporter subunit IIA n=1 Tax=Caldanaerobacter sp. TaxID=2930036 RepID=UPI003C77945E
MTKLDILVISEEIEGSREEILSYIADVLLKKGFVKEGYKESLLEREDKFPTGLYVNETFKVAIPHTEISFANRNVLVIVKPLNPVYFKRMDDPTTEIEVDIIFVLVIKEPDNYLKFLSKLTENLANEEFIKLVKDRDIRAISEYINEFFD